MFIKWLFWQVYAWNERKKIDKYLVAREENSMQIEKQEDSQWSNTGGQSKD